MKSRLRQVLFHSFCIFYHMRGIGRAMWFQDKNSYVIPQKKQGENND